MCLVPEDPQNLMWKLTGTLCEDLTSPKKTFNSHMSVHDIYLMPYQICSLNHSTIKLLILW